MDTQKSNIFWVLFIGMAIIIVFLLYDKYGRIQKVIKVGKARSLVATFTAASAANYTQRQHDPLIGVSLKNCSDVITIGGNILPAGYNVVPQALKSGVVVNCLLRGPKIDQISFSVIGTD